MGRPRIHNPELPNRVYFRHGAYYYDLPNVGWQHLGRTEAAMYKALGALLEGRAPERTLSDVMRRYRTDVLTKKAPKTQRDQIAQLARLEAVFGKMRPTALRAVHVAEWHDMRGKQASVAANRELALLRHVLQMAIRWGYLEAGKNPAREVARHTETPRDRYITDAEFAAVYALATPLLKVMMDLSHISGRREGELLTMKRSQITDAGIEVTPAKRGRKLLVKWSEALRDAVGQALTMHPVASMYLIADAQGQPIPAETFRTAWGRLMNKALAQGVISERFTFHDLRAKAGTDGKNGEHLGHTSQAMLDKVYLRKPKPVNPTY